MEEAFGGGTVAAMEESHLVEDGDAVGGVEVNDGVGAQTHIDTRSEHVLVTVWAKVLVGTEVRGTSWAISDGGFGVAEGFDGAVCRIVDMGNEV